MSLQDCIYKIKRDMRSSTINPRLLVGIACMAIAMVSIASISLLSVATIQQGEHEDAFAIESPQSSDEGSAAKTICVHVSGSVACPGVVYVDDGSRVADAIDAAGGFSEDAARDSANLARLLEDGEQIRIMSIEEQERAGAGSEDADQTGVLSAGSSAPQSGGASKPSTSAGNTVNINTATLEQLQTLSGIGKSKAQKIIDYRTSHGAFRSVDELTKVSGIGDKTLESIRSSICV